MHAHSSLSADPVIVQPLRPAERMDPYVRCWCLSGKKFKFCHFRRETQTPVNIFELEKRMNAELRQGYCSFPSSEDDPCSGKIANAHTIQRRGGLGWIADEQHVLTVKPTMKMMIEAEGQPEPRRIGVGNASVFPGFCGHHDTALFKPIEGKQLAIDINGAFLFAYRAIAYERFAKEAQLRAIEIQREMDRGHPFWKQVAIQELTHLLLAGIRIGARDGEHWKAQFDDRLISENLSGFHFVAVRFNTLLPFVSAGAFHVEYDMVGNLLQRLGRDASQFEHMSVNVTAFEGETIAVFGWVGTVDGPAARLAQSFIDIPDNHKADALLRLVLVQSDNIFLRPSWWDGLKVKAREEIISLIQAGLPSTGRTPGDYQVSDSAFLSAKVGELTRG